MIMRFATTLILLVHINITASAAARAHPRPAFVAAPSRPRAATAVARSQAEDHLEELQSKWSELKQKEKQIEQHPDENAAYKLTQELLETALDQVKTQEEVEMEHASAAYTAAQTAVQKEREHLSKLKVVHHDAVDADEILENYSQADLGEDLEKRREEAVADIAHSIEETIQSKFRAAKQEELRAREEEEEAWHKLEELKANEEQLKTTLEELKEITKKE